MLELLSRRRLLLLVVLTTVAGTACKFGEDVKQFSRDLQAAGKELSQTLGVMTNVNVTAEDLESPRHVTVRLQAMPPGLTREQIERNANIVLRKHLPRVEKVVVVLPGDGPR